MKHNILLYKTTVVYYCGHEAGYTKHSIKRENTTIYLSLYCD